MAAAVGEYEVVDDDDEDDGAGDDHDLLPEVVGIVWTSRTNYNNDVALFLC